MKKKLFGVGSSAATDADADAFIAAAGITDATQKSAINTLVVGLKADSLWTKMKAIYPFVGGTVNWVRVNTTYRQKIKVKTQEDFDYVGIVQFTIEPRCTMEKVEYIIKSRSGNLYFERFLC